MRVDEAIDNLRKLARGRFPKPYIDLLTRHLTRAHKNNVLVEAYEQIAHSQYKSYPPLSVVKSIVDELCGARRARIAEIRASARDLYATELKKIGLGQDYAHEKARLRELKNEYDKLCPNRKLISDE